MSAIIERLSTALSDRYRIERELGAGGMATVYLAEDLKHHRRVALKVLRPELAAALGPERFLREIETTAKLRHPHILPLYDSGEGAGFLFYVMPYVEGESLRDRLAREKQLPIEDSLQIAREVADALSYAHSRGVIHRDIKPENILLESGHAVVADFGIARAVSAAGGERLTETGLAIGTVQYMSPEQASGEKDLDGRSDLYALGCVLYEMLAGQPPFTGPTVESVVHQHLAATPPSITHLRPAVPAAVASVLQRALAKTPADRFNPVAQFSEALRPLTGPRPPQTQPVAASAARAGPRRWIFLLGAAAGIAGVALLAARLSRTSAPDLQLGRRTQITLLPGLEIYPALSPDGDLVAYTAGPNTRLYVRQTEGGNPIEVTHDLPDVQIFPFWSPDGKQLTFTSARGIETVPALGGAPRLLVPVRPGEFLFGGPWSPDAKEIAFVTGDTLFAVPTDGGIPRAITTAPQLHSCAWAADGKRIACVTGNSPSVMPGSLGNVAQSTIMIVPAAGGAPRRIMEDSSANLSPVWRPDGTLLFLSNREGGRDVYSVRLATDGRPVSTPRRLTTGLNAISIALSASGTRLAYTAFSETSNIWSLPIPTSGTTTWSQARAITSGNQVIDMFDISRDGRWIAFASDRAGTYHIYRMPRDGNGEPDQVTRSSVDEFWPRWSPDGKEIAFHSFRNGRRQIYLVPSTGGPASGVAETDRDDRMRAWSPDGQFIVVATDLFTPTRQCRIIRRKATGGGWESPTVWRQSECAFVAFSPDGKLVASLESDGLWVTSPTGEPVRKLVEGRGFNRTLQEPAWSSDGRTLYYLDTDSLGTTIQAISATGGPPRLVMRFDDPTRPWHRFGFAAFQDRLYFTVGELESDVWMIEIETK